MSEPAKPYTKVDIVNYLGRIHDWRCYLEIGASSISSDAQINRSQFSTCHRLLYSCPAHFDDGIPVDFRSHNFDISNCLSQIQAANLQYDVILLNSWHEYATSYRDLSAAFQLLKTGGVMVVHGCLPPNADLAMPTHQSSSTWCGVTYKAYLDFIIAETHLNYYTVDIDYGCGIIKKITANTTLLKQAKSWLRTLFFCQPYADILIEQWQEMGDNYTEAFHFLHQNAHALLCLKTFSEFLQIEHHKVDSTSKYSMDISATSESPSLNQ